MTSVNYFTVSRFTEFDDVREGGGADVFEAGGAGAGDADMTEPGGADEMGSAGGLLEVGGTELEAGGTDVLEDFATFFATSVTIGPSFVHLLISSRTVFLDSSYLAT